MNKIRTLVSLHVSEDERSYVTVYHVRVMNPRVTDNLTSWFDIDVVRHGSCVSYMWRDTEHDAIACAIDEVYRMAAFDGVALRYAHRTGTKFYDFQTFVAAPIDRLASIGD